MDSDCRQILRELEALFSRDEELQEIADINKMAREIAVQSANAVADSQEEVKSKIGYCALFLFLSITVSSGLTAAISAKEAEIMAPPKVHWCFEKHITY